MCQIFTDVEGVFTADPRIVKDAVKLDEVSYDEMLELASMGSKVMQARAVEFAKKNQNLVILGGIMGGTSLDADGVKNLASLPSLDELRGKLVGMLTTPATRIAGVLQAPAGQVARVISAKAEQGEAA